MHTIGGWTLEGELGRGGMGVVHRARDAAGRAAALKLLPSGALAAEDLLRFQREVQAQARLDHPALVRVLDAGLSAGRPWVALELVEGEDLERRLRRAGPVAPREAAALAAGLARGLEHAHQRGVLHRDVKPANVLLRASDGAALLADFGLARLVEGGLRLTATQATLGSPEYMAPEQARGEQAATGAAADVYGLGATLFALLVGQPPLRGASGVETLTRAAREPRPPLRSVLPGVDPGLARIVDRALALEPSERWPGAGALAAALERWLRPAGPARAARGLLAASAGGALLLGGAGVWFAPFSAPPARPVATTPAPAPPAPAPPAPAPPAPAPPAPPVLAADPTQARAWLALGRARLRAGEHAAACEALDQAIELDPSQALAWAERGLARRQLGQGATALADYDRALELAPNEAAFLSNRAAARSDLGNAPGALADAERALALAPDLAPAHVVRALALEALGDLAGALAAYDRALALVPDEPEFLFKRGYVRMTAGDPRGAIEDLERGLVLGGPGWPRAAKAREWIAQANARVEALQGDRGLGAR